MLFSVLYDSRAQLCVSNLWKAFFHPHLPITAVHTGFQSTSSLDGGKVIPVLLLVIGNAVPNCITIHSSKWVNWRKKIRDSQCQGRGSGKLVFFLVLSPSCNYSCVIFSSRSFSRIHSRPCHTLDDLGSPSK